MKIPVIYRKLTPSSDMGVNLYTAYGFVHNGNFMQYKL
jgi:hypothetical protein